MFSLDQPGCRGILVSHRRCNPLPKLRGLKPHKSVLQFCRREVRRGSHWAHTEVLADKFLSGGLRGKPVSSACRGSGSQRPPTFSSTRERLSPPSQPTALGLCVFPQLTRWPPASTFKGPVIALGGRRTIRDQFHSSSGCSIPVRWDGALNGRHCSFCSHPLRPHPESTCCKSRQSSHAQSPVGRRGSPGHGTGAVLGLDSSSNP